MPWRELPGRGQAGAGAGWRDVGRSRPRPARPRRRTSARAPPARPGLSVRGVCNALHMTNAHQTKAALWAVCVAQAGIMDGARLVEFIDDWRDCVNANGGPVSWQGYSRWTRRYSPRTAYNRLALFRRTFPQLGPEGSPEGLLGPLLDRLAAEAEA